MKNPEQVKCVNCQSKDIEIINEVESPFDVVLIFKCPECGKIFSSDDWEIEGTKDNSEED